MEEYRDKIEFVCYCRELMEEAGKGVSLSTQTETLDGEIDVPQKESCIEDVKAVEVLDSGVCDVSETNENSNGGSDIEDVSLNAGDGKTGDSVSDEKQVKADVGSGEESIEKTVSSDDVERPDSITEPETERNKMECEGDAKTVEVNPVGEIEGSEPCKDVQRDNETVKLVEVETKDETAMSEIKSKNGAIDDNKMDIDSKHASEEDVGLNEQSNPGSETNDANHSESAQVPEESTQVRKGETSEENQGTVLDVSSAAIEITNSNQKEENGEAMEIDYAAEEHVKEDVTVGNADNESGGASVIETQDVPIAEAVGNDSNVVKEMEIDESKDNVDMATDLSQIIESDDLANPKSPSEDVATGEAEPLDHNTLFDPSSDITNFIDFGGVSSWSGHAQELKTETGNVSLKEDKKATDMKEEVSTVDCSETLESGDATVNAESRDDLSLSAEGIENEPNDACVAFGAESPAGATDCSKEASDALLESEENQNDEDHQGLSKETADQQDVVREEDNITHEVPSIDSDQKEDPEMEENYNNFDYADDGTGSDIKANGVKRKADVLSEDSPGEGRKTVSLAKVSYDQRPSFKIGACIARAASQMAGSPSVLKGSNVGDENLSVESFVSQLQSAATDPVKENVVSDTATGFFLDYRNSSVSQQVTQEKVNSKRVKTSDANAGGTEAFEFEEMGDTYWTDRVVHNGGEEQTPPTEKGNSQYVPVELKPAQLQRTRRPYRRRQSQISIPLSASDNSANFDENAPAELIMNFSESDTIPPEKNLSKMFKHFGPIQESHTEVDKENNRARIVFKKGGDAEVAYNSAGRFNIFGTKTVNYELKYTITESFKVQPYVVSLGEEDATLSLPSLM